MRVITFSLCLIGGISRVISTSPATAPRCTATTPLSPMSLPTRRELPPARTAKIVCVGDIHGQWNEDDERALHALHPDLVLFVGDYGDEDVRVTKRISEFATSTDFSVATVFGNHDAFFTASHGGRRRAPYDKSKMCRVTEQMEMLRPFDVSYRSVGFEELRISICGGRAFSVGGPNWKHSEFYRKYVGIENMKHSVRKMKEAVQSSQYPTVVFLSHSGPVGLGSKSSDPCGKDWGDFPGGDYGDEDLRAAIEVARDEGLRVPLAVFGHMHKQLNGNKGKRTMVTAEPDGDSGGETVMVNAAVVPRHRIGPHSNSSLHHFQIVQIGDKGCVESVTESWVTPSGEIAESDIIFEVSPLPMSVRDPSFV